MTNPTVLKTQIEKRLARINFNEVTYMEPQEIRKYLNLRNMVISDAVFIWNSDISKLFESLFSQYAKFAGSTYNAIEIGYFTNIDPRIIYAFVSEYGMDWDTKLFHDKRIVHLERGDYTIYNAGNYWARHMLKELTHTKSKYKEMQGRLSKLLKDNDRSQLPRLGSLLLALVEENRKISVFFDTRLVVDGVDKNNQPRVVVNKSMTVSTGYIPTYGNAGISDVTHFLRGCM